MNVTSNPSSRIKEAAALDDRNSTLCSLCKRREAIYLRPYSGEALCKRCFLESVEEKVRAAISTYKMFRYDDRIGVALSGGKDSLVLLNILARIEEKFPKSELIAISVDEGIRNYRLEALKIARDACRELGIPHIITSFKELYGLTLDEIATIVREEGLKLTPCSYCGVLRRRALNLTARKEGVTKLALAHNLDDEIQTAMLNIIHGDIQRLLRSSPVSKLVHQKFVQRVKPLCLVPERETTLYAYLKGMNFQSSPCPYSSLALRNDLRNALNRWEEKHPGIKYTIFHSIQKIVKIVDVSLSPIELRECESCGEPTPHKLCNVCTMLNDLEKIMRR